MSSTRNIMVSHTSIYMFGDVLRHSVSLIMLPIYTRYLTPEDYGTVELLSMLIDFTAIIIGVRAGQAVFRFYCAASTEEDKNSIIASAIMLGVLLNGLGAILIVVFSGPLAMAVFSDYEFRNYIALFATTLFLIPLSQIPLTHIRAQQRPWLFFISSLVKLVLQLSLNIYFVVYLEMHVLGVIYSAVITGIVMGLVLTAYSLVSTGFCATTAASKILFTFSLPLKLAGIATFYLTFGDRLFLRIYTDLSQVGIYALGYKFGFIFTLLAWTPFERMWDAEKYLIHKKDDAKLIYQRTFLYTNSFLFFVGLCISIFSKDLIKVMSDPAFLDAYKIVPIIIVAYIFQAWSRFCNLGILLEKRTMQIAYAEFLAAMVITFAYFALIPEFGIYGAAWATVIGFAARFYWTHRKSVVFYNMELPWLKIVQLTILALVIFTLSLLAPEALAQSLLFRSVLILAFVAIYFFLPILTKDEKRTVMERISRFVST